MRRITLLLAAILTVCSLNAQKGNKNEKVVNIDKINYRITYNGKMVPDTTTVPYNYWESEMRLDIGSKTTHFYDRTKQISDSIMDEQAKTGQYDMSKIPRGGRIHWEFYKNYPSKGQTTLLDKVLGNYYQCTEQLEVPNWQLIPDSTTTIIGYKCLLAKALFKGRNLVCLVLRRHTYKRRTLENFRTAWSCSTCLRPEQTIHIQCYRYEHIEWDRKHNFHGKGKRESNTERVKRG